MKPSNFRPQPSPALPSPLVGFTLIELLTVIAIVGILAGILIPVISSARASARTTRCAGNIRQLATYLLTYATDHKNTTIYSFYTTTSGQTWGSYLYYNWLGNTSTTYTSSTDFGIWRCPENSSQLKPSGPTVSETDNSYMINGGRQIDTNTGTITTDDKRYAGYPVARISNPSQLAMLIEGMTYRTYGASGQTGGSTVPVNIYPTSGSLNGVRYAHNGKANVAYADGHVQLLQGPIMGSSNPAWKNFWFSN